MNYKNLSPLFILMLCVGCISFSSHADLKVDTDRLNRYMSQLKQERLERERLSGELLNIPAGCFQMGGDDESYEKPVHEVCVRGFKMGKFEVTQGQWRAVMGANPSKFENCGDDCPVERVSWDDIQGFLRKLNQRTGLKFRLPSEAEWEYACRGGKSNETYCGGNDADRVTWYDGNSGDRTHRVGGKAANAFGLHDMSGNVWEWTQDCWKNNYHGAPTDGSAWQSGNCERRVLRGGSWFIYAYGLLTASRFWNSTDSRTYGNGFRLVLQDRPA